MSTDTASTTLGYYDQNAAQFANDTLDVEFSELQDRFARRLPAGGRVLDLGCGSGRDARAFKLRGYDVVAVDGSKELCALASKVIGQPVVCARFDEYEPEGEFDGIWACSSLLHVPADELPALLRTYVAALKPGGVFYLSFKYGAFAGYRGGRWFTDLDEDGLAALLVQVPGFVAEEVTVTRDVRPGRGDERWLNCLAVKL